MTRVRVGDHQRRALPFSRDPRSFAQVSFEAELRVLVT